MPTQFEQIYQRQTYIIKKNVKEIPLSGRNMMQDRHPDSHKGTNTTRNGNFMGKHKEFFSYYLIFFKGQVAVESKK